MSRNANPGELRTPVRFCSVNWTQDSESYYHDHETTVLETLAKWVNVHGSEAFSDSMLKLTQPATLTIRYSDLVHDDQLVYKGDDPVPFEIISSDDVEERHEWMEIHVRKLVSAR